MNVFWGLVAVVGAVVFLLGANSGDAAQVWSIYLVNLVFWSGLAVTGPAIAGMMQITEARWSPSIRRIALTTSGFLPTSFILLLILYMGQTALYPWVTTPIPAKAGWLNVPFFWLRTLGGAALLFAVCFFFVRALLRDPIPPDNLQSYELMRSKIAVPLATGEAQVTKWGFKYLIEHELIDYLRVDPVHVGGVTETKKIAIMGEVHDVDLALHNPTSPVCAAVCVHVDASSPNFGIQEAITQPALMRQIFPVQPEVARRLRPANRAEGEAAIRNE